MVALVTVDSIDGPPTLDQAARQIGIAPKDVVAGFGVVPVDALRGVYCVQVIAARLPLGFSSRRPFHGPFSDVPIIDFDQDPEKAE